MDSTFKSPDFNQLYTQANFCSETAVSESLNESSVFKYLKVLQFVIISLKLVLNLMKEVSEPLFEFPIS